MHHLACTTFLACFCPYVGVGVCIISVCVTLEREPKRARSQGSRAGNGHVLLVLWCWYFWSNWKKKSIWWPNTIVMRWSCSHTQEVTQQLLAGHSDEGTALWLSFCPITKPGSPRLSPSQKASLSLLSTGNNHQQGDPARGSLPGLLAAGCRGTGCAQREVRARCLRSRKLSPGWGEGVRWSRHVAGITAPTHPAHLPTAGMCSLPGESAAVPWALPGLCTLTTALPCYLKPADSHPANTIPLSPVFAPSTSHRVKPAENLHMQTHVEIHACTNRGISWGVRRSPFFPITLVIWTSYHN